MNPLTQLKKILILPILIALTLVALAAPASATLPPGNTVQQWNKIAEDTVVGSGAFQTEGLIYMSYTSAAVYDAAVAIDGDFEPYGPLITAPPGASVDCAVIEAAYRTLVNYFPLQAGTLGALYAEALSNFGGCTGDGGGGTLVGQTAATNIITLRTGDGRMIPIGTTSSFPTLPPGPGVWRLTPPFQSPQTPWVGNVRRFILQSVDQFLPDPPPSLHSHEWVEAFTEVKAYGPMTGSTRTDGFGPVPGYNDGNPATVEQAGWRPLLTTPNHPEYPSAHGTLTSAMAEVFRAVLGTNRIDLDIHGFDPAGPAGNLNAVRHFEKTSDLRREIINARLWAGLHYRLSTVTGIALGRQVAKFDLKHAFQPVE